MVKNNTLEYRVTQLEKNMCDIEQKLDIIRTNHLPHIQSQLEGLSTRIMVLTGVNLAAIIIGIIASRLIP
jgi:hypothetical protein